MVDLDVMRQNMIAGQIQANRVVSSDLIHALRRVRREIFVPEPFRKMAYSEYDIPVTANRFLLLPMVLCRMIDSAVSVSAQNALVVGCGPGYGAALLSFLADRVVAVDKPRLTNQARKNLPCDEFPNVQIEDSIGLEGWSEGGPYDIILVEGGAIQEDPPYSLLDQLAEGGRIVFLLESGYGCPAYAVMIHRCGDVFERRVLFEAHSPCFFSVGNTSGVFSLA